MITKFYCLLRISEVSATRELRDRKDAAATSSISR
nr:MAG TPA: hypothetical protein [Caudoviricetes sp.]